MSKRKFLKQITLFVVIFGSACFPLQAQQQKIGYVNTDYILSNMPEYKGIQQQLKAESDKWHDNLDLLNSQLKDLKKDFSTKKILYTDKQKKEKRKAIQQKQQQRKQYMKRKFGVQGDYFKKQQELLEPIQRKIFNAINKVAKRQGFDFVFDRAQNSGMLYGRQEWNLNKEILNQLDITLKSKK